MKRRILR
nr:unnamed protein product [Arabidopsis thaliana]